MLELTQSTHPQASMEAERINSRWKRFAFHFHKRIFLSRIDSILSAAAGHESNALPRGNSLYQVLSARADSLCTEFAKRWGLNLDLLRARIPGLAKLAGLSVPPTKNYVRLACLSMLAIPTALFLLGMMAGLFSVAFHLVGGR